jgi:hypothetical protein
VITADRIGDIADIIATAPAWARQALTSTDPRVRSEGADEVSAFLLRRLDKAVNAVDPDQLTLPMNG